MLNWLKSLFAKRPTVLVVIPVAAEFPNRDEMAVRNAIIDELDSQGFGKFVGSGGGFGTMDFEYEVADVDAAKKTIATIVQKHMPGAEYKLTVE